PVQRQRAGHVDGIYLRGRPSDPVSLVLRRLSSRAPQHIQNAFLIALADAASCCPTALAMLDVTSLISRTAVPISRTASTAFRVEAWIRLTFWPISEVALAVCPGSALTSWAPTAKPRPASPARAASIVAFSARRLVCSAIA